MALIDRSTVAPEALRWPASSLTTAASSSAATQRLPESSNASPYGLMTPLRSTAAVGLPPAASCAAVNITTLPSATTDTHRFPDGSNATTFGPGSDEPNEGLLSMVMSGIL